MPDRTLVVTSCVRVFTGTGKNGKEFSIYEVMATKEDGDPVDLPFRSFDDLSGNVGSPAVYDVQPYDREGHDRTYTLKPKDRPKRRDDGPRIEQLERRVQALEERLDAQGSPQSQSQATAAPLVPADEDIPF